MCLHTVVLSHSSLCITRSSILTKLILFKIRPSLSVSVAYRCLYVCVCGCPSMCPYACLSITLCKRGGAVDVCCQACC